MRIDNKEKQKKYFAVHIPYIIEYLIYITTIRYRVFGDFFCHYGSLFLGVFCGIIGA